MARITVEDCLAKIPSRFLLVNMVAKRVRQIREGSEYLVNSPKNEDIVVALREVAAKKVALKLEDTEAIEDTEDTEHIEDIEATEDTEDTEASASS